MRILCRNNRSQYTFQRQQNHKEKRASQRNTSNVAGSTILNYKMGQADFCFIPRTLILTYYIKIYMGLQWLRPYYRKNTSVHLTEFRYLSHGRCREAQSSVHPLSRWLPCNTRFYYWNSDKSKGSFEGDTERRRITGPMAQIINCL